jgi:glutamyl-tRNA synthetase
VPTGRFAPSPSGSLHLGNLRTALLAWCAARHDGSAFLVRMEDLTTGAAPIAEAEQLADLASLGLDHDGPVLRQSDRRIVHHGALDRLTAAGWTYPCWCTRREIAAAAAAPHGPGEGIYPGTCRDLTAADRRARERSGRAPALRLRAGGSEVEAHDRIHGTVTGVVDDVVLCRADGVPAYNLAVVVDDAEQGIEEVVRGDDLLHVTPTQVHLQRLLGLPTPAYLHVPLVLAPDGRRLAKRDGAVTLAQRRALGETPARVVGWLAASAGLADPDEELDARTVAERFDVTRLERRPWVFTG